MSNIKDEPEIDSVNKLSDHCRLIVFSQNENFKSLIQLEFCKSDDWLPILSYEITRDNIAIRIEHSIDGKEKSDTVKISSDAVKNFVELVKSLLCQDLLTNWQKYCNNYAGGQAQLIFEPDTVIDFDSPIRSKVEEPTVNGVPKEPKKRSALEDYLSKLNLGDSCLESKNFIWREAKYPDRDKKFCVKTPRVTNDDERSGSCRHRLEREATLLRLLDHPGIVKLKDSYFDKADACLLLEDTGESLRALVEVKGPFDLTEVIWIGQQICMVLKYLHELEEPVLYLNLSPTSVTIDEYGQLKLVDFSEANILKSPADKKSYSQTSRRRFLTPMNTGSDFYSLGKTLATLASEAKPFHKKNEKTAWQKIFKKKKITHSQYLTNTGIEGLDGLIYDLINPAIGSEPESAEVILNRLFQLSKELSCDLDFSPDTATI